jgi:hypothetical protein
MKRKKEKILLGKGVGKKARASEKKTQTTQNKCM